MYSEAFQGVKVIKTRPSKPVIKDFLIREKLIE